MPIERYFDRVRYNNKTSNLLFDEQRILWLTSYENGIFKISFPEKTVQSVQSFSAFNSCLVSERDIMPVKMLFRAKNGGYDRNRLSEVFCFSSDGVLRHTFPSSNYNIGMCSHYGRPARHAVVLNKGKRLLVLYG